MKRMIIWLGLIGLFNFSIVYAQDSEQEDPPVWVPVYEEVFSPASEGKGWIMGTETSETTVISRSMVQDGYLWDITSPKHQYSIVQNSSLVIPEGYQIKVEAAVKLPYYEPPVCSGIVFGADSDDFDTFLVCNDQTYGFYHHSGTSWSESLPFTPVADFNQGEVISLSSVIRNGWVDLYLDGKLLNTFPLNWTNGSIGLFAQPLSDKPTEILYKSLRISLAPQDLTASSLSEDVPSDIARVIRMLQLKGRIDTLGGDYRELADWDSSLAQMGYFQNHPFDVTAQDFLIQSEISWKSAYEKPDTVDSGCGFTFRENSSESFLQAFVALDGNIYVRAFRNGTEIPLVTYNYGQWSLEGNGIFTVVCSGSKISFLYNQQLLGTVTDATWISNGHIGLTVFSGTNYDFGISCSFRKNQLYLFSEE